MILTTYSLKKKTMTTSDMHDDALHCISPLDGRYRDKLERIRDCFSEAALIENRMEVEMRYWKKFVQTVFTKEAMQIDFDELYNGVMDSLDTGGYVEIKSLERKLHHDVKSVEQFIRTKLDEKSQLFTDYVHFGLTSHDVNSIAMAMQLSDAANELYSTIQDIHARLCALSYDDVSTNIPMLSRTHGQPATPTILSKELDVYAFRLYNTYKSIENINIRVKFGGATGNFNTLYTCFPDIDWRTFVTDFVAEFHFKRNYPTTQVGDFISFSEIFHAFIRVNTVLIDACRDLWHYISLGYFTQRNDPNEIGSSTMPHKINPINFENAEGNLLLSNTMLRFFAEQFQLSRLQRDLVNSTLYRNIGVALGHAYLGYKSFIEGLRRLEVNHIVIERDLESHYEVLSEPLQVLLKRDGNSKGYELAKKFLRGKQSCTQDDWVTLVNAIDNHEKLDASTKSALLNLSPSKYAMQGEFTSNNQVSDFPFRAPTDQEKKNNDASCN